MTSVRELLEQGAASPSRSVDVGSTTRVAGRRRRNRRGVSAAIAVVVAIAVVLAVVDLDRGDASRSVVVPPAASTLEPLNVPEGWIPVSVPDAGIALAIPPEWKVQFGDTNTAAGSSLVVVGNAPRSRRDAFVSACEPTDAIPSEPGTWLSLYEYSFSGPEFLPAGDGISLGAKAFVARPATFVTADAGGSHCGSGGARGENVPIENSADLFPFRDGDRMFLARIVTVGDPDRTGQNVGRQVLDTLRVMSLGDTTPETTTSTVPDSTRLPSPASTVPAPTTTLPPPQVIDDERAASDAVVSWLDGRRDVATSSEYVEDYTELKPLLDQGRAQHTSAGLAAFRGRVDDVTMLDDTHAAVHYTLYNGESGAAVYGNLPGLVVKADGRWKVSRDTVCDLLAKGGITCPPRGGGSTG